MQAFSVQRMTFPVPVLIGKSTSGPTPCLVTADPLKCSAGAKDLLEGAIHITKRVREPNMRQRRGNLLLRM